MFVFRVENNDGEGPYKNEIDSYISDIFERHLVPQAMGHSPTPEHYFSWKSISVLKGIINEECRNLFKNDNDWKVSIYEVDAENCTVLPDGQVMFLRHKSTLIKRVNFANIYRLRKYNND